MKKGLILGSGSIGSYLAVELEEFFPIKFLDFRNNRLNTNHEFIYNDKIYNFQRISDIDFDVDIIFVCLKSYQVNSQLIEKLLYSNKLVIFFQNGIFLFSKLQSFSNKFLFANLSGIEVHYQSGKLESGYLNPTVHLSGSTLFNSHKKDFQSVFELTNINVSVLDNYESVLQNKYPRWLLTNLLLISTKQSLGKALEEIDSNSFSKAVQEFSKILKLLFRIEKSPNSLKNEIQSLPPELTTSSYRDFCAGKPCEFIIEIELLLEMASKADLECPMLTFLLNRSR